MPTPAVALRAAVLLASGGTPDLDTSPLPSGGRQTSVRLRSTLYHRLQPLQWVDAGLRARPASVVVATPLEVTRDGERLLDLLARTSTLRGDASIDGRVGDRDEQRRVT